MDNPYAKVFSIVIASYNYGHYVTRAIDSILAQGGNDYEIILVDDGSTDNTAEIVRAYQAASKPITYLYQKNLGLGAARNRGVKLARGQYLLFLDADDALVPSALHVFRSAVASRCEVDFVLGGWVLVSSKGRVTELPGKSLSPVREETFVSYMRGDAMVVSGSAIIHRRVFDRLAFPETVRQCEDRVFYAQLFALYAGHSIPDPVVTIYRHPDSLAHDMDLAERDAPKTVDLVFDPLVVPNELLSYRSEYRALVHRALFEKCYECGRYQEALEHFHETALAFPTHIFSVRHIRRYLKTRLALLRHARRSPAQ
jgi:glycosyltransferase involved in cell wall biosynthesis